MIKKTTAIVFMLITNILILAHAVVPHHHHNKQVCLVKTHCINDDFKNEHGTNHDSHSHDGDNNSEDCVLKDPVIVLSNQWKADFKFNNKSSDRSGLDDFDYKLMNRSTEFLIPEFYSFIYKRYTDSTYPSLISLSLGLRAPPVV